MVWSPLENRRPALYFLIIRGGIQAVWSSLWSMMIALVALSKKLVAESNECQQAAQYLAIC